MPFTTVIRPLHLQMMSSSKEGEVRTGAGQSTGENVSVGCMYMYISATQNSHIIKRNHQRKVCFFKKKYFSCRFLPLNFKKDDILGIHKDRMKIGASLADVDPMHIDRTVSCIDYYNILAISYLCCLNFVVTFSQIMTS